MNPKTISVPPDGGWGWTVCFSYALSNIITVPILQNFGLIFQEKFQRIGFSATDISIIINVNSAFGMIMGLVNGSLLKTFGYRKVAIIGAVLISGGMIFTAFSNNFISYIISYGLITSLGIGMSMSALSLALNTYFRKKRGQAFGFAMTGTGLGSIVMPLLISYLLDIYDTTGCVLIISALSMHSLIAAFLLQPVKWHAKKEIPDQELMEMGKDNKKELTENLIQKEEPNNQETSPEKLDVKKNVIHKDFGSLLSIDHDVETQSIYGFETPMLAREISSASDIGNKTVRRKLSQSIWQSGYSIHTLGSMHKENIISEETKEPQDSKQCPESNSDDPKSSTCLEKIIELFDLNLLCDPIYVNLMLGMSVAICAEINFSLLTPFILKELSFGIHESAYIMSTIATTDIIFRFCSPYIADWLHKPPRIMYMFSLTLLILSRSAILFVNSYTVMLMVALSLGVAKGFRTVFMSLLIPSYVPVEKLPSAGGIQMVVNGIVILLGGPLLGVIRDFTGNYNQCILVINAMTLCTIIMWMFEFVYIKLKKQM